MPPPSIQRGDIIWGEIKKEEIRGSEQYGRRPMLVVSANAVNNTLPIVVVVPLSEQIQKVNQKYRILIPESEKIQEPGTEGCSGESLALTEQVRVISKERLDPKRVARVTPRAIASVEIGVAYVLGIA